MLPPLSRTLSSSLLVALVGPLGACTDAGPAPLTHEQPPACLLSGQPQPCAGRLEVQRVSTGAAVAPGSVLHFEVSGLEHGQEVDLEFMLRNVAPAATAAALDIRQVDFEPGPGMEP